MTDFQHWAGHIQQRMEQVLDNVLPSPDIAPQRLHQAMRYAVMGGGKRVRALLTHAAGEFCGGRTEIVESAAAAVELIHAYSLVHDDMPCMDDDDLRRGKPSCHKQYDDATALLVGDATRNIAVSADVKRLLEDMSNDQLNWRPTHSSWSIAQVLSHLVASHRDYIRIIDSVLATANVNGNQTFKSSWPGNMMVKVLSPGRGGRILKLKAPRLMEPPAGLLDADAVLRQYLDQQRALLMQLENAANLDIQARKIPLSVSKLLKLPAGDVWRFITAHNERHLLQMQKVKIHLQEQMEK